MFRHLGLIDRHAQLAQSCKLAFKKFKGILAAKARLAALPGILAGNGWVDGEPSGRGGGMRGGADGQQLELQERHQTHKVVAGIGVGIVFGVALLSEPPKLCASVTIQTCLEMSNNDSPLVSCAILMCASECACLGSGGGAGDGGD